MKATFKLTNQGEFKLMKVLQKVHEILPSTLKDGCDTFVKPAISNRAPSLEEEARLLSQGIVSEMGSSGRGGAVGGNPDDTHFRKGAGQYPLKEAILMEEAIPVWQENRVNIFLGKPELYNPGSNPRFSIGFSWLWGSTKSGGIRSTDDADAGDMWRYLLQSWEYGGSAFTVTPRRPGGTLKPERGVSAKAISKTIPPFGMFIQGKEDSRVAFKSFVENVLKGMVAADFGGTPSSKFSFGGTWVAKWGKWVRFGPPGSRGGTGPQGSVRL